MSIAGVIFDLDGTLADTLADIAAAANFVLAEEGLPTHAIPAYKPWIGEGVARLLERALPPDAGGELERLLERFKQYYTAHLIDRTVLYPGIPKLLVELAARQIPIAVLSNKPDPATRQMVRTLFPSQEFIAVIGHRPEVPRKPDPTSALSISRLMKLPPERCALVGDTGTDIETARAAGMVAVAALWGFRSRVELEAARPSHFLTNPASLLDIVS